MKNIFFTLVGTCSIVWMFFYFSASFRDLIRPIIGSSNIELAINLLLFFVIILPLSFFLFLLPPHYFTRFWYFAIWGLPLTITGIVYINLTYDSGLFGFGAGFDLLLVGAWYLFFIFGSLIQLARAWRTGR